SVTIRQTNQPVRRRPPLRLMAWRPPPLWPPPRLDPNPVLWREWHRQRPSRWVRLVWLVYAAGAGTATVVLACEQLFGKAEPGFAAFTTALQSSVGLLLASVAAVTSLAEERVRGSLDVLLTTPLPTRTIVWGKWRGAFRLVPRLALLPVFNVLVVAKWDMRWTAVPLTFAVMLTYGAAVTGLG